MIEAQQQIERFKEFITMHYEKDFHELIRKGTKSLLINFSELLQFDPELADNLLDDPEEVVKAAEIALTNFELPEKVLMRVRFYNLPESQKIKIRDIRSNHLNDFLKIEGIVRQASDVRPQVTSAKFECPSCGNNITILQIDTRFKEPFRCSCGRKGKFRLISKELVDVQRLVLEEAPEALEGGEQPKRLTVFLKDDLVEPRMEKKTTPGSKVRVTGVIKEVPLVLKSGTQSTRYDLMMDSNFIEPVEEIFEEIEVNKEEEEQIKALAKDPKIYEKLIKSIAPSIYGHDDVKEALVLQLFGGVRKIKSDGTKIRGDLHVLLIGDPGCISGDSQVALINRGMEKIQSIGQYHLQPIREAVTKIRKDAHDRYYDFATIFQRYPLQSVLKVVTETGKEVICTYNQPFLTKEGWKRADEIPLNTEIRVMPKIPTMVKKLVPTGFVRIEKKSGPLKEVSLPERFTPELASLCGYIIGDGNVHPNGYRIACYINDGEKDLIEKLSKFWKNTFNVEPVILTKESNGKIKTIDDGTGLLRQFVSTQQMHLLEINSRQVAFSFSFLSSKRVPQQIFKSPKHVISKFISWLFEADGCAFGNGRGRTAIQLKSRTPDLLKDVQLLLLYFGIHSRIIGDNLCIRRSYDMKLFAEHIGFNSEKKKRAIEKVLEAIDEKSEIQKRKRLQRYERVMQIIPFGVRDVYDFEVPLSHTFIANGIVCHNSGKSATLQFITKAAPKARFVSGKGASAVGLTASIVKDEFLRGWALEAGAMVLANKGIAVVDELDKMSSEDRDALHEAMEQQSYHHKTEILFADGSTQEIGNFVDTIMEEKKEFVMQGKNCEILPFHQKVLTTDFKKIYPVLTSRVSRHKAPKYFIKIKYSNGREITVTPEHPIFIFDNEVRTIPAEQITHGQYVPAPKILTTLPQKKSLQEFTLNTMHKELSFPPTLTEEFSSFLGYFVTEGHSYYQPSNSYAEIGISNTDPSINLEISNLMKNLFKTHINYNIALSQRRKRATRDLVTTRCCSVPLYSFFQKNFESLLTKAPHKRLPNVLKMTDQRVKRSFLKTAFKGNGFIDSERFGYTTASYNLAKDYQDMLLNLEIWSYISTEHREKERATHKVVISGAESMKSFLEKIVDKQDHRFARLQDFILRSKQKNNDRNVIPHAIIKEVRLLLKELRIYDGYFNETIKRGENAHQKTVKKYIDKMQERLRECQTLQDQGNISLLRKKVYISKGILAHHLHVSAATIYNRERRKDKTLFALIKELSQKKIEKIEKQIQKIDQLLNSDIRFVKVKSVRKIENKNCPWVYDITVEPNHTFVSEGLVLHNTITIAKANINATLNSETTILAAANPKLGRFDPYQPIAAQIDLPPTLINRFDLIFPIRDLPNKEMDTKIASHVLKLQQKPEELKQEIATPVLKKYISYAKQKVFPVLTDVAIDEIKNFYVTLRNKGSSGDESIKPIPISARQLEALVRLAEGSARVRLSQKVTREDAKRAIALLQHCLMQVGFDYETGQIDIDRIATGVPASEISRISVLREIINTLHDKGMAKIPLEEVILKASEKGITEEQVEEIIEKLKRSGDLFEPTRGFIARIQ